MSKDLKSKLEEFKRLMRVYKSSAPHERSLKVRQEISKIEREKGGR